MRTTETTETAVFQSTPSLRKATFYFDPAESTLYIFQSTPSLRKATNNLFLSAHEFHISIHTFLAEGDIRKENETIEKAISIHTFLAEGDNCHESNVLNGGISIHTFLAEGDIRDRKPRIF